MNSIEIQSVINSHQYHQQKQKQKSVFRGVFACDDLPKRFTSPAAFIINLSRKYDPGSHWVALCINDNGLAYYFDSFGMPPKNTFINHFIRMNSNKLIFNRRQIQHITSTKCGKYCCVFVVTFLKNYSSNMFLKKFSTNLYINEIVIENMFNYFFKKTTHI